MPDTADTRIGRAVAPAVANHPHLTGVYTLAEPLDAFAIRFQLANVAERSIDAQYFIWRGDAAGNLLFQALARAADRGVRVRLLLDDYYTGGLDATLGALGAHANLDVRLYNPFVLRDARAVNMVTDFARVNRRMHNKSFTVDNQASVVGGRNVANAYFAAGSGMAFADLDVIAVGEAVGEVSREFDVYWNSPSAYPVSSLLRQPAPRADGNLDTTLASTGNDAESGVLLDAARQSVVGPKLFEGTLDFQWVTARAVYDDPAKTLDATGDAGVLLFPQLVRDMQPVEKSLDLISPYFVPGEYGAAALAALAGRGVKVRILTNSLASSDVKVVHSGYARRREALLRAGVALYELKPTAAGESHEHEQDWFGVGSLSALHAKTFAVDGARGFVGSFNFDQRSALLNTEMGLVVESAALARRIGETFDTVVPRVAYEVRLAPDGRNLEWIERTGAGETRYDTEPATSWWLRAGVNLLQLLPIEWLL